MRVAIVCAAASAAIAAGLLVPGSARTAGGTAPLEPGTRAVLYVANNWDGTADIIDPATFQKLDRFNVIPDLQERLAEIYADPVRLGYYLAIRNLVGEGHDQYVDDMFSSHDGRFVYISRPSLGDVVAIDLATKKIAWRFRMEGNRTDHMAISPDGKRLLVSDSTITKVQELDAATGAKVGEFQSGDTPHENSYSKDGSRIFHASIGRVYTPTDQPAMDTTKGNRWFQVVEAGTNKILERLDIGQILEAHGYPDMSSAVRPMAVAPDENIFYLQLSFFHGFVVFDLAQKKPLHVVDLPKRTTEPRENYLLDSAHHGLTINPEGTKLCAAGTMDGYAALVSTADFSYKLFDPVDKPYWSTNSGDGRYCFVSASGSDEVVVLDYEKEAQVARIPVGDHPQRMRMGSIRSEFLPASLRSAAASQRAPAKLEVRPRRTRGRLELRLRANSRARGRLAATYTAAGTRTRFRLAIPSRPERGWTVTRTLPRRQRGATTGLLDLSYGGNAAVAADRVRLRLGTRAAALRARRARIDRSGRLILDGTISRRARGVVGVRIEYAGSGTRLRTLRYRAPIRSGRWRVRALLPSQARSGAQLTLHYGGDARRRIRGEVISRRLAP